MQTKAKRKLYNALMAVVIVVIAVSGIMAVGHLKGWFGGPGGGTAAGGSEASLVCTTTTGVVQVERSGVGYTLKENTVMQDGDIVAVKNGSEAVLAWQDTGTLSVNEKSEVTIETCTADSLELALQEGEVYAQMQGAAAPVTFRLGEHTAVAEGAVFSVSEQSGAGTVYVYAGQADVTTDSGEKLTVAAGEQLLLTENEKGEQVADITKLSASALSPYIIEKLLASPAEDLCFTAKDLEGVKEQRAQQKAEADKALEEASIKIAEGEAAGADVQENGSAQDGSGASSGENGAAGQSAAGTSGGGSSASGGSGSGSGGSGSGSGGGSDSSSDIKTCTITIECSSILDNMGNLKEGKDRYVPANGVILATSAVEFRDGETAYDVTKRACEAMGIQIEASYVPLYESYYVEGINHLYEFDCGGMSGWLYFVNGWSPNYGCSEYVLKDGDSIVWEYTCTGN